jgi:hypothetical protein
LELLKESFQEQRFMKILLTARNSFKRQGL